MAKDEKQSSDKPVVADVRESPTEKVRAERRQPTQDYRVVVKIGGAGDPEVFLPGSRITLDDERAQRHLAAGNIVPLDHTELPELPAAGQVIHETSATATKKG